jgi:hypothetical protein
MFDVCSALGDAFAADAAQQAVHAHPLDVTALRTVSAGCGYTRQAADTFVATAILSGFEL